MVVPAVGGTLFEGPVAFVDVETTGGRAGWDRIIEIGIVTANGGALESEWSTLVNPGMRIPGGVQQLTGITDEVVRDAPRFEELAAELMGLLQGRLFVAHNARFDYGFFRGEFKRAGRKFSSAVACTVRLSRRLFPEVSGHSLDALIGRHGLECSHRHRALPDAQALWQFWSVLGRDVAREDVARALDEIAQLATPPAHLPRSLPDEMPEGPGVYLFYGADGALLYVGKAGDIRQAVLDHWQLGRRSKRARRLVELTARVEWIETVGELGARLARTRLIEEHRPRFNKVSRALTRVMYELAAPDAAMAAGPGGGSAAMETHELPVAELFAAEPAWNGYSNAEPIAAEAAWNESGNAEPIAAASAVPQTVSLELAAPGETVFDNTPAEPGLA